MDQSFLQQAPMQFTDVSTAAQPNPAGTPAKSGGGGLMGSIMHGITQAPGYFLKADIINPTKELAASLTGNKVAEQNAVRSAQQNLVGNNKVSGNLSTNATNFGKQLAGNTAQLAASTLMPEGSGLAGKAIAGARAGALGGGGSALANNQNVLQGALTGGVAGGVLAPVAPKVLGVAGKLAGLGGKTATAATEGEAGQAAQGTVGKVINNLANKQSAKQSTMQAAQDSAPYGIVDKSIRQNTNMNGLFGNLRSVGMGTTPDQMQAYHDILTGANGVVSRTMNKILSGAGDIKPGNLLQTAEKALSTENTNLGSVSQKGTPANGLMQDISNALKDTGLIPQNVASGKGSDIVQGVLNQERLKTADTSATNAFKTLQNLETLARNADSTTAAGQAQRRVLNAVRTDLANKLWNDAGVNKAVAGYKLSPEDLQAIQSNVAEAGGSPQLAQHVIDGINNANTGPELRAMQEPAVRAGQLASAYDKASGGALTAMPKGGQLSTGGALMAENLGHAITGNIMHAAPAIAALAGRKIASGAENLIGTAAQKLQGAIPEAGAAATGAATNAAQSTLDQGTVDAFTKAGTQVADNGDGTVSIKLPDGRTMTGPSEGFNNIQTGKPQLPTASQATANGINSAANVLKTMAGRGGVLGAGAQGIQGSSANPLQGATLAANTSQPSSSGQLSLSGSTAGGSQQQPQSEYPLQNMLEDIQRDPIRASTYEDLYKMMNPNYQLTTTQQNEVTGAQKAQQSLQDYWTQLTQAGGGKGAVGGRLEDIAGALGFGGTAAAARALNSQRVDVAASIAGALSPTGRPTQSNTNKIADSLPSITDPESVAQDKMNQLMQRIQDGEFSASQTLNSTIGQ